MKGNSNLYLIGILLLVSCGKSSRERTSAPKTEEQLGIIASCTTRTQAAAMAETLDINYRILNEKRKIVEFIGAKKQDLINLLPKAKLKQNKLYQKSLIQGNFSTKPSTDYPYYGPHTPQYRSSSVTRYFPHLAQINALNTSAQGEGVTIAIVDTGIYYNHPHLSPNILTNSQDPHGEDSNYLDDDQNGFTDDYVGWDFYNGDAYPLDDNGHGTHVAGLAASTYMGVAPKAKLLPVKVLSADGSGDLGTIAAGIMYALDRDADIINLSLGGAAGEEITSEIKQIINSVNLAKNANALLIAAAGNGGNDGLGDCNDNLPIYPANIQAKNILSVAAVDAYNQLTEYSNYGGETVHIAAPGGDPYTGALSSTGIPDCNGPCTEKDITYAGHMGTSMATPIVAGVAAVVKSVNLKLHYSEIKSAIMNGGTNNEKLAGLVQSASVVNLAKAIQGL